MKSRKQFFDSFFEKDITSPRLNPHQDIGLRAYLRDINALELLSPNEEERLLKRSLQGDPEARRRLIEANLRLVILLALKFQGQGPPLMDLIQEGNIGLMYAIERFDFAKGQRVSTYAKFRIVHALGRAVAEQSGVIYTPYVVAQKIQEIDRLIATSLSRGMELDAKQIASNVGLSTEQVLELLVFVQEPLSLTRPNSHAHAMIGSVVAPALYLSNEVAPPALLADVASMIEQAGILTEQERQVIVLRLGLADGIVYGYHEIAEKLYNRRGVRADVRIRQVEKSALDKLQAAFQKSEEA